MEITKVVTFKFEDGKVNIAIDGDKDGVPAITIIANLAELPSEIAAIFSKKPAV